MGLTLCQAHRLAISVIIYGTPDKTSVPMVDWSWPGTAPSQVPRNCSREFSFCSRELGGILPARCQPLKGWETAPNLLFGAEKCPELWITFRVTWGKSLKVAQAGNSLKSKKPNCHLKKIFFMKSSLFFLLLFLLLVSSLKYHDLIQGHEHLFIFF